MQPRYILSPYAEEDFTTLLYELAEAAGWSRSMRTEEQLYAAFNLLAANPGIGHLREDVVPRSLHVYYSEPYMVIYRRDTTPLSIVAILHGARDIAALLEDR